MVFMEKGDWYKLLALGFVAVFVIEMVALGALNTGSSKTGGTGQAGVLDITGNVVDNVTITRYEPYLLVSGNGSGIEGVKQRLIDRGEATYAMASGDGTIVNLNGSRYILSAAAEFENANATVLANAVITMSETVKIVGQNLTTEAQGSTFKWQIRPIYPEGSKVLSQFVARSQGGQVVGMGSLTLLPESVSGVFAEAKIDAEMPVTSLIEIPWAARTAARQIARGAGAAYKEKSFVNVLPNATQTQLDAIRIYDYITGVQSGVVSVKNDFVNETRAARELSLMKLAPVFPPSLAYFANLSGNDTDRTAALLSELQSAGVNATLVTETKVRLRLPDKVGKNGKEYATGGRVLELAVDALPENATTLNLTLDFEAAGSAITRITAVRQA